MKSNIKFTPWGQVAAVSSVIICIYYFVYMVFCLTGFDTPLMAFFALFVMGTVSLPLIFKGKLKNVLKRAYTPLKIIFVILLVAYIVSVIGFWCYIGLDSSLTPSAYLRTLPADYTGADTLIMVFGCRTFDMTPGATLIRRLDAAYTLLSELPDSVCIVSGGQGSNETVPEALSMCEYLKSRGIEEKRIIMESKSHSTSENIRFSKTVIEKFGLLDKKIIGVSTAFHLPRIAMMSSRYGLTMELCAAPHVSFPYHYVSMVREYMSYIKMALFG